MGNNSLYLHPEYLAPPEQFKEPWMFEFAMVNPNFIGKKYRYVYGVGFPDSYFLGTLMKLDVQNKEFVKVWEDSNCMATEPYFVPRPGSKGQLKFIYSEKNTEFLRNLYLTFDWHYIGQK